MFRLLSVSQAPRPNPVSCGTGLGMAHGAFADADQFSMYMQELFLPPNRGTPATAEGQVVRQGLRRLLRTTARLSYSKVGAVGS